LLNRGDLVVLTPAQDNEERAQRCKDLANDIANDQSTIGQIYDKLEYQNSDKGLIAALTKIAKQAKVTGIAELKDKALAVMSPEDRKYIISLQEQLTKDNKSIQMELQIAGAIGGVGAVRKSGIPWPWLASA
jgi:hypothetical protein